MKRKKLKRGGNDEREGNTREKREGKRRKTGENGRKREKRRLKWIEGQKTNGETGEKEKEKMILILLILEEGHAERPNTVMRHSTNHQRFAIVSTESFPSRGAARIFLFLDIFGTVAKFTL